MARYFGNFISRIPFLREAESDLRLLVSKGNLAAGLIYPLLGWAYNKEHFIGVFETDLGVNCFEITSKDSEKKKNLNKYDLVQTAVELGQVATTGYNGPTSFCQLNIQQVPYDLFLDAEATADFDGYFINKKRVEKIVARNKKRCDTIVKDFNILAQTGTQCFDLDKSRNGYGSHGMTILSPFHILLQHKEYPHVLYNIASPDMLYKQPQLELLQAFTKDKSPSSKFMAMVEDKRLMLQYDDPITSGDDGYYHSSDLNGTTTYGIPLDAAAIHDIVKPIYRTMFSNITPSRKPVVALPSYWRRLSFLSRFKNERLAGSQIQLDSNRMFRTSTSGEEASTVATEFLKRVDKGKLGTPDCVVLDDSINVDELIDECRIYELTGALGGIG